MPIHAHTFYYSIIPSGNQKWRFLAGKQHVHMNFLQWWIFQPAMFDYGWFIYHSSPLLIGKSSCVSSISMGHFHPFSIATC